MPRIFRRAFRPWTAACLGGVLFAVSHPLPAEAAPPEGYKPVWADEFDGNSLDTNKWIYWLAGRRRDAVNTSDAVSVTNGCLTITTYTQNGKNYTGMISTKGKFERVHGYWEARIRFEDSPGTWSAFWLQSPTMGEPVGNTAKAGIEIDICEHRLISKENKEIAARVQHTLHWDGYGEAHQYDAQSTPDIGLDAGFHIYGFEWTDDTYRFYVDGKLTWTNTKAVSNANEFTILSSEVQDFEWAGRVPAAGYGDLAASKTKMIVDYVRCYAKD